MKYQSQLDLILSKQDLKELYEVENLLKIHISNKKKEKYGERNEKI
jgi:hypothetical protein